MEHLKILCLKLLAITVTIYVIFGAADYVGYDLLWIGIFTTVISYIIGDMMLLPRLVSAPAILADFGLGFVSVWLLSSFFIHAELPIITLSIISAFLFTAVEPFVHTYVLKLRQRDREIMDEKQMELLSHERETGRVNRHNKQDINTLRSRYATEFAQESHVHDFDHQFYYEQGSNAERVERKSE